jgi:hypothetical protein
MPEELLGESSTLDPVDVGMMWSRIEEKSWRKE